MYTLGCPIKPTSRGPSIVIPLARHHLRLPLLSTHSPSPALPREEFARDAQRFLCIRHLQATIFDLGSLDCSATVGFLHSIHTYYCMLQLASGGCLLLSVDTGIPLWRVSTVHSLYSMGWHSWIRVKGGLTLIYTRSWLHLLFNSRQWVLRHEYSCLGTYCLPRRGVGSLPTYPTNTYYCSTRAILVNVCMYSRP